MPILSIHLKNILCFKDNSVNFTYSRKIKNSLIPDEYLKDVPTFNYKKINILFGSNSTGKTSLIKVIWKTLLMLKLKNKNYFLELIETNIGNSELALDITSNENNINYFNRFIIKVNSYKNNGKAIKICYLKKRIMNRDNYNICDAYLKSQKIEFIDLDEFLKTSTFNFDWNVRLPALENDSDLVTVPELKTKEDEKLFKFILNKLLLTLDPSISKITIDNNSNNEFEYVIHYKNNIKIIIQNRMKLSALPF